jgi:hypothetical protein
MPISSAAAAGPDAFELVVPVDAAADEELDEELDVEPEDEQAASRPTASMTSTTTYGRRPARIGRRIPLGVRALDLEPALLGIATTL